MPAQEIDRYRSLARLGRSDITVMKSRFLGYAGAALTEEDAKAFIAWVRAENPDCSAVLYGYVCGLSGQIQRYEDAHEPSGGLPILEASVQMVPSTWVELTNEDDIKNMRKMLEIMDENDDIQNVWHNWDEPEN